MSKLLQDALVEIASADFYGMNDGQAFSVCKLWSGWAKANASSLLLVSGPVWFKRFVIFWAVIPMSLNTPNRKVVTL